MSARRWWLVRASQEEVVAAADHRLVPGAVGPANRDGWVTVAHSGGDPHGLLTDRPQLQVVPVGDELTVLVRREGGETTTWTGGAQQDTELESVVAAIVEWFGGIPGLVAEALREHRNDALTLLGAVSDVSGLPQVRAPGALGRPLIGHQGNPRLLRRIGHHAGPSLFVTGPDDWNFIVPAETEGKWTPPFILEVLRRATVSERRRGPFALWSRGDEFGPLLRVMHEGDESAVAPLGPRWVTLGDAGRPNREREERLVAVLSEECPGVDVRAALDQARALPGRSGAPGFLDAVGLPRFAAEALDGTSDPHAEHLEWVDDAGLYKTARAVRVAPFDRGLALAGMVLGSFVLMLGAIVAGTTSSGAAWLVLGLAVTLLAVSVTIWSRADRWRPGVRDRARSRASTARPVRPPRW